MKENKEIKSLGLCKGRHNIPGVEDYIFENNIDPLDLKGMDESVHTKLQNCKKIKLYVTGLTVALVAVINYCSHNFIELTLYHYDRNSQEYYSQKVFTQVGKEQLKEGGYI